VERRYTWAWTGTVRALRRLSTETERQAWRLLRNRGVLGLKCRRQHRIGPFIVDFYCAELRLAIEIDGGCHESREQQIRDAVRTEILQDLGVKVLRLTNADVTENNLVAILRPFVPLSAPPES